LIGQSPISLTRQDVRDPERAKRRFLAPSAFASEIVSIDNVDIEYSSSDIADFITCEIISGMSNHGVTERRRRNNLNFYVTMNDGTADRDQTVRSFSILLGEILARSAGWEWDVKEYIDKNRELIQVDIIDTLKKSKKYRHSNGVSTRFPEFESEVLSAFCKNQEEFDMVIDTILERQKNSDADSERSLEFKLAIDTLVAKQVQPFRHQSLDGQVIGIANNVLGYIYRRVTFETKASQTKVGKFIHTMIKRGELPRLHEAGTDGHLDSSTRGFLWVAKGGDIGEVTGVIRLGEDGLPRFTRKGITTTVTP
jgi:hypothetical protein